MDHDVDLEISPEDLLRPHTIPISFGFVAQTIAAISAAMGVFMAFWPDLIQIALGWTFITLLAMLWRRLPITFFATVGLAAGLLYYGVTAIFDLFMFMGNGGDQTGALIVGTAVFLFPMVGRFVRRRLGA